MNAEFFGFDRVHRLSESATHPSAPLLPRHAALLLLAGNSLRRRRALPGTPPTALAGASNCHF
ncbi:hypothetical protein [uncultured Comamonas sp.]|uniref:hypothetical protein n=1 Tax=uncultured Comamonas sp. TaxID=114710 RepID=UPI000AA681C6|nr:hypothetical protein [uncultured Comamonas sp.]